MNKYDLLKSQFDTENSFMFVVEREGAQIAFLDFVKKHTKSANPYHEGTAENYMWSYGYKRFEDWNVGIKDFMNDWRTQMQKIKEVDLHD